MHRWAGEQGSPACRKSKNYKKCQGKLRPDEVKSISTGTGVVYEDNIVASCLLPPFTFKFKVKGQVQVQGQSSRSRSSSKFFSNFFLNFFQIFFQKFFYIFFKNNPNVGEANVFPETPKSGSMFIGVYNITFSSKYCILPKRFKPNVGVYIITVSSKYCILPKSFKPNVGYTS